MSRFFSILPIAVLGLLTAVGVAHAQDSTVQGVRIGLVYDPGSRPGVIVLPVDGAGGDSIRAILQRDFDYGDRINVVGAEGTGFPLAPTTGAESNYPVYAALGAVALVQATVTGGGSGLHVAVHDVAQQSIARVRDFPLRGTPDAGDWRLGVHSVADEIELWITGVRGVSASRVLYVSGGRIWVVDSDGFGPRPVSAAGTAMSPAWHPDGTHLAYAQFVGSGWSIMVEELSGGARPLPAPRGLNATPTFSPDGNVIVWAHGGESGTDLFATTVFTNGPARRITVGRGSDNTSPTFSPDGRRVAFTSGRSGHPEVYISDADGTNAELLTPYKFGDQSYRSDPDWSPDGRTVAFQAQLAGRFQVMTIGLRDRSIRQHTNEGSNEQPSWAPDSRHLVFTSTRSGTRQLWVLDTETGRTRQLTHSGGVRMASWSPYLGGR
jgi:TolB protein